MATEFITSENSHWYASRTKKDVYYPSVTTILGGAFPKGPGFDRYLANQQSYETSQEILKAAGLRGTNVHSGTELLEQGNVLLRESYTLEEWKHLETFVKWHKKYHPELIALEQSVVSDTLKTGGTIDRIYMIDGVRTLLDIKTSSAIHPNYWVQVAAYVMLWEEDHPTEPRIEQVAILRTGSRHKDGYEFVIEDRDTIDKNFQIFQCTQMIWTHLNPKAKPAIVEVPDTLSLQK